MIRAIAAIDEKDGLADEHGIPWQGKLPTDIRYFREETMKSGVVLMGYNTYLEFSKPLGGRQNFVASKQAEKLRPGFELVMDVRQFLQAAGQDIWVIGGAGLFAETLDLMDELHLTKLEGDFHCTKFFPLYEDKFQLVSESELMIENGIRFRFTIYRHKRQNPQ